MKRILFVSANEWMPWGGSEELWSKTALKISDKGYKVLVSVKEWEPMPEGIQRLERRGIQVFKRKKYSYSYKEKLAAKYGIRELKSNIDVLKEQPDLVVINQGDIFDGIGWARTCNDYKIPYV